MFHVFQIESSVSMKMNEFKSLMNLWWSFLLSDRVEDSCWERASFWLTRCSADWVSWRSIDWSTWRCFALKFNRSSCNWLIFFSSSSFLSKATSSCFALFLWFSCTRSQYSLSCKVKSYWLQSSFSILMTSSRSLHWECHCSRLTSCTWTSRQINSLINRVMWVDESLHWRKMSL